MTKSFTRPGIVTSRSSDRELDKYLGDAGRAMNAFPAQRRSLATSGTAVAQTIWTSQAYLPGTLIKVIAEVVGVSATGAAWLDYRMRKTYLCNATGNLVEVASSLDYVNAAGAVDSNFAPNLPSSRYLSVTVLDPAAVPMKWTAVIQILEQQP